MGDSMSRDAIEDVEFTCPQCGSHHFGANSVQGSCHGYDADGRPCRFSWPRSHDFRPCTVVVQ